VDITDGRDLIDPGSYADQGAPHETWTRLRREELHGQKIRNGEILGLFYASANRAIGSRFVAGTYRCPRRHGFR